MGTRDLIKPLLAELGTVHFGRIAFKPGKPTTFATVRGKLAFGLPGYPVSSLVSFEVFVRPALRKLGGHSTIFRPKVEVEVEHEVRPDQVGLEYQRAVVRWEDGRLVARTTGGQGSSRLLSMRGANALLEIAPGRCIHCPARPAGPGPPHRPDPQRLTAVQEAIVPPPSAIRGKPADAAGVPPMRTGQASRKGACHTPNLGPSAARPVLWWPATKED